MLLSVSSFLTRFFEFLDYFEFDFVVLLLRLFSHGSEFVALGAVGAEQILEPRLVRIGFHRKFGILAVFCRECLAQRVHLGAMTFVERDFYRLDLAAYILHRTFGYDLSEHFEQFTFGLVRNAVRQIGILLYRIFIVQPFAAVHIRIGFCGCNLRIRNGLRFCWSGFLLRFDDTLLRHILSLADRLQFRSRGRFFSCHISMRFNYIPELSSIISTKVAIFSGFSTDCGYFL